MTRPTARRDRIAVRVGARTVRVAGHDLPPLAAFVWAHADGSRDVASLAATASQALGEAIDEETIWSALDTLGDADLLEQRVAPPAAGHHRLTRRDLLRAAGAALVVLGSMFPHSSAAEEPMAPSPRDLDEASRRALREADAARQRGDESLAAEKTEEAKEASRKRTTAERDAEQRSKNERSESFESAPARRAPATRGAAEAPSSQLPNPADAGETPVPAAAAERRRAPEPAIDDRQRHYQEQDLKRTQERNLKRQP